LHVATGGVDIAIQLELQRDARLAERADGGHLAQARDAPEAALQRRRDGGRHRLGAGAGQRRTDRNGGVVDARQRRDWQLRVRGRAGEQHGGREQRSGDGPPDERLGNVHGAS